MPCLALLYPLPCPRPSPFPSPRPALPLALQVKTLDGRTVWRRRHYRVKRGKVPGTFYFSVLDNGGWCGAVYCVRCAVLCPARFASLH